MNIFRLFTILFTLVSLSVSCSKHSPDVKTILDGSWAMDILEYKGEDIFQEEVYTNMMSFNTDNSMTIPKIGTKLKYKEQLIGQWKYLDDTKQIYLKTKNDYLKGEFYLCFKKDIKKGNIRFVLSSKDLYMEASKVFSEPVTNLILPLECDGNGSD